MFSKSEIFVFLYSSLCRLSGAALVVPFVHYWWPCVPAKLSSETFGNLPLAYRWTFRVAHYAPWLMYGWMTQKLFPSLSILSGNDAIFNEKDLELLQALPSAGQVITLLFFGSLAFISDTG